MTCENPIWIRNPRYFGTRSNPVPADLRYTRLASTPWDVARQFLLVPCGKCESCLRKLRSDWFVRLERELAYQRTQKLQSWFVTITIKPELYAAALADPRVFIRKWCERVRHRLGYSVKHFFVMEFGTHPKTGSEPRLHFHGFLFGLQGITYNAFRSIVSDFGYVWISAATRLRARYCVKYVVKDLVLNAQDEKFASSTFVSVSGRRVTLRDLLCDSRYTRRFVSPFVGNYLGGFSAPTVSCTRWRYFDPLRRRYFIYSIPRYYQRFSTTTDKCRLAIRSAYHYAVRFGDMLFRRVITLFASVHAPTIVADRSGNFSTNFGSSLNARYYLGSSGFQLSFDHIPTVDDVILSKLLAYG